MASRPQTTVSILAMLLHPRTLAVVMAVLIGTTMVGVPRAQAQTYTVLHEFTGGDDGGYPQSALVIDRAGNLYGTAVLGGRSGEGVVFKMEHSGSGWTLQPLYSFYGGSDGAAPWGPLTMAADGSLYGTTLGGGNFQGTYCKGGGCGVVFRLRPPASAPKSVIAPWDETVLYAFDAADGNEPLSPQLLFDQAGDIYGTTQFGGYTDSGTVFELTPHGDGWGERVLYQGFSLANGVQPYSGLIMDSAGNLYGTTSAWGPGGDGVVYELSPSQDGYVWSILHAFNNGDDGGLSYGGLVMDQAGNLYGGTVSGGTGDCGVIYELSPSGSSWTFNVIYNLPSCGGGPYQNLVFDAAGNLYGTAFGDGTGGGGMVFKLTNSNGTWSLTDLHDFSLQSEHFPVGAVAMDSNGNLYGTTESGGTYDYGVVWEITP